MPAFTATLVAAAGDGAPGHVVHASAASGARVLFAAAAAACGLTAHRRTLTFTMGGEDVSAFDGSVLDLSNKHGAAIAVGIKPCVHWAAGRTRSALPAHGQPAAPRSARAPHPARAVGRSHAERTACPRATCGAPQRARASPRGAPPLDRVCAGGRRSR